MYLAWMLTCRSLRQSKSRLALVSAAVGFCVCLILVFAAFWGAFGSTTATRWQGAIDNADKSQATNEAKAGATDAVLISLVDNPFFVVDGKQIHAAYVDTSATQHAPDLFGVKWPQPGEYLMSLGVQSLVDTHPEATITTRFGHVNKGLLPYQLTSGPDDLLVFIGKNLAGDKTAVHVADFDTPQPPTGNSAVNQAVLSIGLVVLLFPVLLLIAISAALGSVQREQRYAALRLVGATRHQILQILVTEALLGAVLGFLLGLGVFSAIRPWLGAVSLAGRRLWLSDLTVAPWQCALVFVATIIITVLATSQGMRGVVATPLGVVRHQRVTRKIVTRKTGVVRILVMAVAIGLAIYLVVSVKPNRGTRLDAYWLLADVVLMMIALILVSPLVIQLLAWVVAKHCRRAPELISTRYVAAHSRQISRSVSGVILALFAGTFFLTATSQTGKVLDAIAHEHTPLKQGAVAISEIPDQSAAVHLAAQLQAQSYVAQAQAVPFVGGTWSLVPCTTASAYVATPCKSGLLGVNLWARAGEASRLIPAKNRADFDTLVKRYYVPETRHDAYTVLVSLRDSRALERLRTLLATTDFMPEFSMPLMNVATEVNVTTDVGLISLMTTLVWIGMGLTLLIAVISMLVSTYAGLLERHRSLLTLRLCGMKVSQLARMMLVEAIAPLGAIALLSASLGFGLGWVMMHIFSVRLEASFTPAIFLALLVALILAGLAMLLLVPALRRSSEPVNNRSE